MKAPGCVELVYRPQSRRREPRYRDAAICQQSVHKLNDGVSVTSQVRCGELLDGCPFHGRPHPRRSIQGKAASPR